MNQILPEAPARVSAFDKLLISAVVLLSRRLRHMRPERLRRFLTVIAAETRPASYAEAKRARDQVLTVSARCRGSSACLIRSISVMLLCRLRGHTPTWCVGVVAVPPFSAHAWVEAEDRIVDEPLKEKDYRAFFKVASGDRRRATGTSRVVKRP